MKRKFQKLFMIICVIVIVCGVWLFVYYNTKNADNLLPLEQLEVDDYKKPTGYDSTTDLSEKVDAAIEAAILDKMNTIEEECTLTEIWYNKEKSDKIIDSYMKYGRGADNGVKRENVIVILSNLKTGEKVWSFEPNAVYTEWIWILIRDDENSKWVVDSYGNQ